MAASRPDSANLTLDQVDPELQAGLERVIAHIGGRVLAGRGDLGVALVDLSGDHPRFAAINGDSMMYAASLPKIAILLGAFTALEAGTLADTPALQEQLVRMIRVSDNTAASIVLEQVGYERVANTLLGEDLRLYDPRRGGGLWVGKAYGRDEYWERDPVADLSHGATPRQVARFYALLQKGELVSAKASARMKTILGNPGIAHKFVRGLASQPQASLYRKSGTWRDYHADSALIEHGDSVYVAVGLVHDADGEQLLQRLIAGIDALVCPPAMD